MKNKRKWGGFKKSLVQQLRKAPGGCFNGYRNNVVMEALGTRLPNGTR